VEKVWVYGALRIRDGQEVTRTARSRNTVGYLRLLQAVEEANPTGDLYLITDNLSSHKSPPIQEWLDAHPRVYQIFIPKGACWLNLQEARPSFHRDTAWRETTPRSYHDSASRPSARRPHAAGGAPVSGTERAALGDRAAGRQPTVCPRLLVRAPRVVAELRRGRGTARGKQTAGPVRLRRIAAQSGRAA
jgi:hypothetical protein